MSDADSERTSGHSTAVRVVVLLVVCLVAAGASLLAVLRHRSSASTAPGSTGGKASGLTGAPPELLFRSTNLDRDFGTVAVVPLDDPAAARRLTALRCARVDYEGGTGLCLTTASSGLLTRTSALVFDSSFRVVHTIHLTGVPSRTRVSPDGRYGASTTFVSGDSYAEAGFSTRTTIIDLRTGATLFGLEKLSVTRDGKPFHSIDFNYWGVTFVRGTSRFYATLGTGSDTYLIEADVDTRRARVIRSGVECPSLSPDGRRIAFKERNGGATITWHLAVLDLTTLAAHTVGETRNVDDQVEWLDDRTLMYALARDPSREAKIGAGQVGVPVLGTGSSIATDTWTVAADGRGSPKLMLHGAWSAVPVRAAS